MPACIRERLPVVSELEIIPRARPRPQQILRTLPQMLYTEKIQATEVMWKILQQEPKKHKSKSTKQGLSGVPDDPSSIHPAIQKRRRTQRADRKACRANN